MDSPPCQQDLRGASRLTGGILRGKALGNAPNQADFEPLAQPPDGHSARGTVHVYLSPSSSRVEPKVMKPAMSIRIPVGNNLASVLKKLGGMYSPIQSMYLIIYSKIYPDLFLQKTTTAYTSMIQMVTGISKGDLNMQFLKMSPLTGLMRTISILFISMYVCLLLYK